MCTVLFTIVKDNILEYPELEAVEGNVLCSGDVRLSVSSGGRNASREVESKFRVWLKVQLFPHTLGCQQREPGLSGGDARSAVTQ